MRRGTVEARYRWQRALDLRNAGVTYQQIAEVLGYSDRSAARKAVVAARREIIRDQAQEQLLIETARRILRLSSPETPSGRSD